MASKHSQPPASINKVKAGSHLVTGQVAVVPCAQDHSSWRTYVQINCLLAPVWIRTFLCIKYDSISDYYATVTNGEGYAYGRRKVRCTVCTVLAIGVIWVSVTQSIDIWVNKYIPVVLGWTHLKHYLNLFGYGMSGRPIYIDIYAPLCTLKHGTCSMFVSGSSWLVYHPTRGQGHGSDSTPWHKCYCPMVCEETGTVRIILSIATYCPAYILQPSAKHIEKLKQSLIEKTNTQMIKHLQL